MTTTQVSTKPPALLTTPAENAECPRCYREWLQDLAAAEDYGWEAPAMPTCSRFSPSEFAHCDRCGDTELVDTRSPFQVLAEAKANLAATDDPDLRLSRWSFVEAAQKAADAADRDHCSDCSSWARKAGAA